MTPRNKYTQSTAGPKSLSRAPLCYMISWFVEWQLSRGIYKILEFQGAWGSNTWESSELLLERLHQRTIYITHTAPHLSEAQPSCYHVNVLPKYLAEELKIQPTGPLCTWHGRIAQLIFFWLMWPVVLASCQGWILHKCPAWVTKDSKDAPIPIWVLFET